MVNSKFLHGDLHDIYVNRHKARAKQSCTTTEYRVNIILNQNLYYDIFRDES